MAPKDSTTKGKTEATKDKNKDGKISRSEGAASAIGDLNDDGRTTRSEAAKAKKAGFAPKFESLP
jgi:hypothetical protein